MSKKEAEEGFKALTEQLQKSLATDQFLAVVKAPPGSGKTTLLTKLAVFARKNKMRVAVATQTNSQADDICRRLDAKPLIQESYRLLSSRAVAEPLGDRTFVAHKEGDIPGKPCIVVGTSKKWAWTDLDQPFDILIVEESWQLNWAGFMAMCHVAPRFLVIGDPGQISPVVAVDTSRWNTALFAPHEAFPDVLNKLDEISKIDMHLPTTWRLPYDTARLRTHRNFLPA